MNTKSGENLFAKSKNLYDSLHCIYFSYEEQRVSANEKFAMKRGVVILREKIRCVIPNNEHAVGRLSSPRAWSFSYHF